MSPAAGISKLSDQTPAVNPTMTSDSFTKDAMISWFRGEFAAANAIIDALCGHLVKLENGRRCEYESVFNAIHRRRLNWIPILQMQKFFSIADVTVELSKVADVKMKLKSKGFEKVENENDVVLVKKDELKNCEIVVVEDDNENGDSNRSNSPKSEITDTTALPLACLLLKTVGSRALPSPSLAGKVQTRLPVPYKTLGCKLGTPRWPRGASSLVGGRSLEALLRVV